MNKRRTSKPARCLIALLAVLPLVGHATVGTLDHGNTSEAGGTVYPGTAPMLRATLSDDGPQGTRVHFLVEPFNLASGDYVRNWAWNFSGSAAGLIHGASTKTGSFDDSAFHSPASTPDGGNRPFSFSLKFFTSDKRGGTRRFADDESLGFDLTLIGGGFLTVDDILGTLSHMDHDLVSGVFFTGESGNFHCQEEQPPVPEPATFAFAGILVAGLMAAELRRRSQS